MYPSLEKFSIFTKVAIQAALEAGDIIVKGFNSPYTVTRKPGKQNFVTSCDQAAENKILSLIQSSFPEHAILSEEQGFIKQTNQVGSYLWIIDPLDGTTNFIHHIPLVSVSIALYHEHKLICGIIFQPFSNELFIAQQGLGAYLNDKRLQISSTKELNESLFIVGALPSWKTKQQWENSSLLYLIQSGSTVRNIGVASLSLAYVAAGKVDGCWMGHLQPWDIAAGLLLIQEAQGIATNLSGNPPSLKRGSQILAANSQLHTKLLQAV